MPAAEQILTVAQMRVAEQALVAGGETVGTLMERAGAGAAEWIWRLAARRPVTVLCGPGNNGGDGYVIARELARHGSAVTVVAPLAPCTAAVGFNEAGSHKVVDMRECHVLAPGLFALVEPLRAMLAPRRLSSRAIT